MAQGGKRLLCRDGTLTLDRQHPRGKSGMTIVHVSNTQSWGQRQDDSCCTLARKSS